MTQVNDTDILNVLIAAILKGQRYEDLYKVARMVEKERGTGQASA